MVYGVHWNWRTLKVHCHSLNYIPGINTLLRDNNEQLFKSEKNAFELQDQAKISIICTSQDIPPPRMHVSIHRYDSFIHSSTLRSSLIRFPHTTLPPQMKPKKNGNDECKFIKHNLGWWSNCCIRSITARYNNEIKLTKMGRCRETCFLWDARFSRFTWKCLRSPSPSSNWTVSTSPQRRDEEFINIILFSFEMSASVSFLFLLS